MITNYKTNVLDDEQPGEVARRLALVFKGRPALPWFGVQYCLCEVGPKRFDPRVLARTLSYMSEHMAPHQPTPGIYVDPTIISSEVDALADEVLAALRVFSSFDPYIHRDAITAAVIGAVSETGSALTIESVTWIHRSTPVQLAGDVRVECPGVLLRGTNAMGAPTVIWISNEPAWIYPDDPRLWHLFQDAEANNAHPIVVARTVAPATFALLKALGGRAVQFHGLLIPDDQYATAAPLIKRAGLPYAVPLSKLHGHNAFHCLATQLTNHGMRHRSAVTDDITRTAIATALSSRFHKHPGPTPLELLAWDTKTPIGLPDAWRANIRRWITETNIIASTDTTTSGMNIPVSQHVLQTDIPTRSTPAPRERGQTEVHRGLIAAEVDRDTWDKLMERLNLKQLSGRTIPPHGRD